MSDHCIGCMLEKKGEEAAQMDEWVIEKKEMSTPIKVY
jgi:hypothetical protein